MKSPPAPAMMPPREAERINPTPMTAPMKMMRNRRVKMPSPEKKVRILSRRSGRRREERRRARSAA